MPSTENNDLTILYRKRGTIKQKLTLLEKFITSLNVSVPGFNEIQMRYDNHLNLIDEFDKVQSIIESECKEDDLNEQFNERDTFQNRYYVAFDILKQFIHNLQPRLNTSVEQNLNSGHNVSSNNFDPLQNVLLPKLKLPSFDGEFHHWLQFKTNFKTIICDNTNLNENQKFQFLKASLDGYASRFIEGLDSTDKPFERAWNLLCERFDKKQFLIDSHFKSILGMQNITRENYVQFRKLLDEVSKHLTSLEGLELTKDILYDSFIIHIVSNKLDKNTIRDWKEIKYHTDLPTLDEFMNFLKDKSDILQCLDDTQQSTKSIGNLSKNRNNPVHLLLSTNKSLSCNYCKQVHTIYKCPQFLALNVDTRIQKIKNLHLCENCLLAGHDKQNCKHGNCTICKRKHNTLLHKQYNATPPVNNASNEPTTSTNMVVNHNLNTILKTETFTNSLLSTVTCQIKDNRGNFHQIRALLDCGAQSNIITEKVCSLLNIPLLPTNVSISGIGQNISHINKKCSITLYSCVNDHEYTISCLVVPVITGNIPFTYFNPSTLNIPEYVQLSDPGVGCPQDVDLLLGANIFWDLLLNEKIKLKNNMLINTVFGWIVTGALPIDTNKIMMCNFSKIHIPEDDQLKKFWEIEEIKGSNQFLSQDDIECESLFNANTFRIENGQFVVKFPLKQSPELLGSSKPDAIRRFKTLEKRFADVHFKQLYTDFIKEYENLGHMTKLTIEPDGIKYFLPHHGILKEMSTTTRLRVVFDGSCKTSTGWSLNDIQYIGPKVQNDIINILLRFRTYKFVVSADISKMYRQILLDREHRPLQQILWRDNPESNFCIYQLNTVTYGTRSAPYLAIKCIKTLAEHNMNQYPKACETILNDMYVDDLLTGSNDLIELQKLCKDIYDVLASANFILRKWNSNNFQVVCGFKDNNISNAILDIGDKETCKILGIQWENKADILKYTIKQFTPRNTITKRHILSIIAQIYDPLGLLSPTIVIAKLIIQKLWSLHISWDEPVPQNIEQTWYQFQNELDSLNQLSIPRNAISLNYILTDVHCFCDASRDAYSCCIYLRSVDDTGNYNVQLLCAKTKVSPLKTITIPKLELCACLLGAQLINIVINALNLQNMRYCLWTDSQVALCWINTEPNLLQTFVANRTSKIQSLTNIEDWRYVNTKENPADLASRGIMPKTLMSRTIWWKGPQFLLMPSSDWPITNFSISKHDLPELRKSKTILVMSEQIQTCDLFTKFSSLQRLKRVTAYCLRFINNARKSGTKAVGPLSVEELKSTNIILIKLSQMESFSDELKLIRKNKQLDAKHKFASLAPFIDENGIIRVGGRLKNTYLPFNVKHPILLSSKHNFTKLIFNHKHIQLLHPGPQLLLSSVRQFYWPVGGSILAKQTVRNCVHCFKFNPIPFSCPMSNLPNERIRPTLPFEVTGVDYAGPFSILNRKGKGAKLTKCYLAIFVCFCTKAIHCEIVTDLTSNNFLACLKRFVSRRGIPKTIYSDNGTTFRGTNNLLRDLGKFLFQSQASIVDYTSQYNIDWKFIPPYSPNHGGLWEAAVKSCKFHLKRALINNNVTYEEMCTLVIQIEGILNSRPLFAQSNDPNDLSPITPSHFLIGRVLTSIPDIDYTNTNKYRLTRLEHIQKLYQQFWRRFSKQYISQLHQQYKWKDAPPTISVGTLVLIKNTLHPPCQWPMGIITQLFPGRDGITRVAEIQTPKGLITRSIRHLCPLPRQEDIDN